MLYHIFLPVILKDCLLDLLAGDVWLLRYCSDYLLCEAVFIFDVNFSWALGCYEKELLVIVFKYFLKELDKNFLCMLAYFFTTCIFDGHHEAHVFIAQVDETIFKYKRFHLQ